MSEQHSVEVIQDDITRVNADAIVNAANADRDYPGNDDRSCNAVSSSCRPRVVCKEFGFRKMHASDPPKWQILSPMTASPLAKDANLSHEH